MLVIALTGGIGSGKSTVADLFADKGVLIVDTDLIAHQLTAKNGAAIGQLVKMFGNILASDGSLDRQKLRQIVFNNVKAKEQLESYLHPLIRQMARQQIMQATSSENWQIQQNSQILPTTNLAQTNQSPEYSQTSYPYALLVIPLLAESLAHQSSAPDSENWHSIYQRVLTVKVESETRKQRLLSSRDLDHTTIDKIIASQASEQQRQALADDIIINDGNLTDLAQQVHSLHQKYLALVASSDQHLA